MQLFNYDKMMQQGHLYNIVGFQTHLKWGPQKEVFAANSWFRKCRNRSIWCNASKYVY